MHEEPIAVLQVTKLSDKSTIPSANTRHENQAAHRGTTLHTITFSEFAMRWVTLLSTENIEHAINMESIVQVISQAGGARQVQLRNGESLLIAAQEWNKLHEQIQRSRGIS